MPIINVPKPLRDKLGDEGTDALVELFNQSDARQKEDVLEFVEEKFERRLSEEMARVNQHITDEIGKVNQRITDEIGKVNQRITDEIGKVNQRITDELGKVNQRIADETNNLRVEIHRVRADLIKWMFIFWIGQIGAILGILFAFFK